LLGLTAITWVLSCLRFAQSKPTTRPYLCRGKSARENDNKVEVRWQAREGYVDFSVANRDLFDDGFSDFALLVAGKVRPASV